MFTVVIFREFLIKNHIAEFRSEYIEMHNYRGEEKR